MKTNLRVGEFAKVGKRVVVCKEWPNLQDNYCERCAVAWSLCLIMKCEPPQRNDGKVVYFKELKS